MPRQTVAIALSESERRELERWRRAGKTERRMLSRIQIIELASAGLGSRQIASRLGVGRPTALKWRRRFGQQRLAGLRDAPRSGPPRRYTARPSVVFWPSWMLRHHRAGVAGTDGSWPKPWAT